MRAGVVDASGGDCSLYWGFGRPARERAGFGVERVFVSVRQRLEGLICMALLCVAPLVLLYPALSNDGVPASLGGVLSLPPWQEARPAGAVIPDGAAETSLVLRYYPWYAFLGRAAQAHEMPLWNPLEGFGAPFLALWRTRALSPFSLPFYLLAPGSALIASVFMKLLTAGVCAYLVARRFNYLPPLALLVGVVFQFSAPLFAQPLEPLADAVPWFPLLLGWVYRLLQGDYRVWPMLALVMALAGLGGSPESMLAGMAFLLLLLPVYRLRDRRLTHLFGAYAALFTAIAACLAVIAVQLLPYIEYKAQHPLALEKPGTVPVWSELAQLVYPVLRTASAVVSSRAALCLHVGGLFLLLIALWLAVRSHSGKNRRRRVEGLLLTALAFGTVPLFLGGLLEQTREWPWPRTEHFYLFWPLALGFLAAASAEEWLQLDVQGCKDALRRFIPCAAVIWGGGLLGAGFALRKSVPSDVLYHAFLVEILFAGLFAALLLLTLFRPKRRTMGYGLAVIVAVSGLWAYGPARAWTGADTVFPETAFIQRLQNSRDRLSGSEALKRWPLAGNGIAQVYNPSGVTLRRYERFMSRAAADPSLMRLGAAGSLLLTRQDIRGQFAALRPTLNILEVFPSGATLLKDLDVRPRSRMIHAARKVENFEPLSLRLEGPPQIEGGTLPEKDDGPVADTSIAEPLESNRVVVHIAEGTRPGVLVLADMWYPGWTATVDGNPAEVVAVDGIFRGVEVGQGAREVVFRYYPASFRFGLYISAGTLLLLLALSVAYRRRPAR